jgi:purine nucleosidase
MNANVTVNRFCSWLSSCLVMFLANLQPTLAADPVNRPVVFMSGGTIDDASASVLLTTIPTIRLKNIQISNSDTLYQFAVQSQWKTQIFIGQPNIRIGLSKARAFNPFPWQYRDDAYLISSESLLNQIDDRQGWPPYPDGDIQLRNRLVQAYQNGRKLVILATAPLTPLADVLKRNPHLKSTIKELVWMGGAINVPGNLDPTTIPPAIANPKAEWNAFWDPYAVDWIFRNTRFPITMFPLDVTDEAKLDPAFLAALNEQALYYRYSALVNSFYGLVQGQPYFEMWNTLTASYLGKPDIFQKPVPMRLAIVTEGFWQGAIYNVGGNARPVNVVLNVQNPDLFYDYILGQLRRN